MNPYPCKPPKQVLLGPGLRRPLQGAALWLAARAAADTDGSCWQGSATAAATAVSCSSAGATTRLCDEDLCTLVRVRKVLAELDVWDDATQPAQQHTLHKFRRCFGALVQRDGRAERYGLRAR